MAATLVSLLLAGQASATSFSYASAFGATGLSDTLHQPNFDAIDPVNHWIYVSESDDSDNVNAVERFNYDGTPAAFTAGNVSGNLLGLPDQSGDEAVFNGGSNTSYDCNGPNGPSDDYDSSSASPRCFDEPEGIAVDNHANFYVVNQGRDVVDIFSSSGVYLSEIGPYFNRNTISTTSTSGTAYIASGDGATYDTTNNLLFVADATGNSVWVFHSDGAAIPTLTFIGQLGTSSGGVGPSQFDAPHAVATDDDGNLFVSDYGNARVDHWSYSYDPASATLSAAPAPDSPWVSASTAHLNGITYTPGDGNQTPPSVFVGDDASSAIDQYSPTGSPITHFGSPGGSAGQFETIGGVASLANDGSAGTNLFIVDNATNEVERFIPSAPANSAAPTIGGTAQAGQTLSASTGTWTNLTSTSTYAYDWQACNSGGSNCSSVQTGSTASLVLSSNYVGETIKVGVTANNGQSGAETFSPPTGVIAAAPTTSTPTTSTSTPTVSTPAKTVVTPNKANTQVTSAPRTTTSTTALSATGQTIKVSTVPGSKIVLQLILDKKTAKLVHLGNGKSAVIVGQRTIANVKSKISTIKVIVTLKARRALSKLHRTFKLTLRTTFSLDGHSYVVNRTETINRAKSKPKKKTTRR